MAPPGIRLQKILADAGVASRRAAERLIVAGAVSVNGHAITELGARADPATDDVRVRGQRIGASERRLYLALHKPPGYVTTASDDRGRRTVLDLLPDVRARVYPAGRLDLDSEGLLLLTNDGELTTRLTHPRYGVEKEYRVLVSPEPSDGALQALRDGVEIEGGRTSPAGVRRLPITAQRTEHARVWLELTIHEGRKRQVRHMCAAIGLTVHRLVRTRVGPIRLDQIPSGRYRALSLQEVQALQQLVGLPRYTDTDTEANRPRAGVEQQPGGLEGTPRATKRSP